MLLQDTPLVFYIRYTSSDFIYDTPLVCLHDTPLVFLYDTPLVFLYNTLPSLGKKKYIYNDVVAIFCINGILESVGS